MSFIQAHYDAALIFTMNLPDSPDKDALLQRLSILSQGVSRLEGLMEEQIKLLPYFKMDLKHLCTELYDIQKRIDVLTVK